MPIPMPIFIGHGGGTTAELLGIVLALNVVSIAIYIGWSCWVRDFSFREFDPVKFFSLGMVVLVDLIVLIIALGIYFSRFF